MNSRHQHHFILTVIVILLPLFSLAKKTPKAPSVEEKFCQEYLSQVAKEDAASMVFERWPEKDTRNIDINQVDLVKCEMKFPKGSFKIIDRDSEVCPGQAEYQGHCSFPKIGGGYLKKTLFVEGNSCCLISESTTDPTIRSSAASPRIKPKASAQGQK